MFVGAPRGDFVGDQHHANKFARGTGISLSTLNKSPLRQRTRYLKSQEQSKFKQPDKEQPWRDLDWNQAKADEAKADEPKSYSFSCTLAPGKKEFKHKNAQPHPWMLEHTYTNVPQPMQLGRSREADPREVQNPMVQLQAAMGVFEIQRDPDENDKLNGSVNEQVRLRKLNKHLEELQKDMQTQQPAQSEPTPVQSESSAQGEGQASSQVKEQLSPATEMRKEHKGWTSPKSSIKPAASPVTLDDIEKPEERLRRLNVELADAQRAMLASPDKQERKRLRRKCRELDSQLGGEHDGFREWKSTSTAITDDRVAEANTLSLSPNTKVLNAEVGGWSGGSPVRQSSPERGGYVEGFLSSRATPMEHQWFSSPSRRQQSPNLIKPAAAAAGQSLPKKSVTMPKPAAATTVPKVIAGQAKKVVTPPPASAAEVSHAKTPESAQAKMDKLIATIDNNRTEEGEVSVAVMDKMIARAQAKFTKLDKDGSGLLEGAEIEELAQWVWNKFHPGGEVIDPDVRAAESSKLLGRMDENADGSISFDEFETWFKRTCVCVERFKQHGAKPTKHQAPTKGSPKRVRAAPAVPSLTKSPAKAGFFSGALTPEQPTTSKASPVTLDDIEKPEERLRRLNKELVHAQEAMLASPDKQERKRLRRKCRELDSQLGGEHDGFREWKSTSTAITDDRVAKFGMSPSPDAARHTQAGFFTGSAPRYPSPPVRPFFQGKKPTAEELRSSPVKDLVEVAQINSAINEVAANKESKKAEVPEIMFGKPSQSPAAECDVEAPSVEADCEVEVEVKAPKPSYAPSPAQEMMDRIIAGMENNDTEEGEVSVAVMDKMIARAQAKFTKLDKDGSGLLEGAEIEELAQWVWNKFHPGGEVIDPDVRAAESSKLLATLDENADGSISFDEFETWFKRTCVCVERFKQHGAKPTKHVQSPEKPPPKQRAATSTKPSYFNGSPQPLSPAPAVKPVSESPSTPQVSSPALSYFRGSIPKASESWPAAEQGRGPWYRSSDGKWHDVSYDDKDDGPWFRGENGQWYKGDEQATPKRWFAAEKAKDSVNPADFGLSGGELRTQPASQLVETTSSPFFRGNRTTAASDSSAAGASPTTNSEVKKWFK